MSKIMMTPAALLIVMAFSACRFGGTAGNGKITTQSRAVTAFSEISASGVMRIEWRNGAPALAITTDENLLSHIDSEVVGNRLRLSEHGNPWPSHGIRIVISSPTRTGAQLSGATRLAADQLSGDKFAIEATGASHVDLDGNVQQLFIETTGAAHVDAHALQTKTAEISATGAAHVAVAASDVLKAAITGAGKVTYTGNPATVEKRVTGAGSIRREE